MLWVIIILLFFILLVISGGGHIVRGIVTALMVLGSFFLVAMVTADVGLAVEIFLWIYGGLFAFVILAWAYYRFIAGFDDPEHKTCPYCDEEIRFRASVCKHCGRDQPPPPARERPNPGLALQGFVRQFHPSSWAGLSVSEYLGAGMLVLGVAAVSFLTFYLLTP